MAISSWLMNLCSGRRSTTRQERESGNGGCWLPGRQRHDLTPPPDARALLKGGPGFRWERVWLGAVWWVVAVGELLESAGGDFCVDFSPSAVAADAWDSAGGVHRTSLAGPGQRWLLVVSFAFEWFDSGIRPECPGRVSSSLSLGSACQGAGAKGVLWVTARLLRAAGGLARTGRPGVSPG